MASGDKDTTPAPATYDVLSGDSDTPTVSGQDEFNPGIHFEGKGTYEDPFQIWDLEGFALISQYPDYSYCQMADLDFADATGFTGSTYVEGVFTGDYDGNGFEMTNVAMPIFNYVHGEILASAEEYMAYDPANYENYQSAIIQDITVVDSDVLYTGDYTWAGVIACVTDNATVYQCRIEGGSLYGPSTAAGIVGFSAGSTVEGCYNSATIRSDLGYRACGIIGVSAAHYHTGSFAVDVTGEYTSGVTIVSNCTNDGEIYGVTGGYGMGGIMGKVENYITFDTDYMNVPVYILNCENNGDLYVTVNSDLGHVGGILGLAQHYGLVLENCTNTGDIYSTTSSTITSLGGILGRSVRDGVNYLPQAPLTITNCVNTGNLEAKALYAGGVLGTALNLESMEGCSSTGTITDATYFSDTVGGLSSLSDEYPAAGYTGAVVVKAGQTLPSGNYTGISSLTVEEGGTVGDIVLSGKTALVVKNAGTIGSITNDATVTIGVNGSEDETVGNHGTIGSIITAGYLYVYQNTGTIAGGESERIQCIRLYAYQTGGGNLATDGQSVVNTITGTLTTTAAIGSKDTPFEGKLGNVNVDGASINVYNGEDSTIGNITTAANTINIYTNQGTIGNLNAGDTVAVAENLGIMGNIQAGVSVTITANGQDGIIGDVWARTTSVTVGVSKSTNTATGNNGQLGDLNAATCAVIYRNTGTISSVTAGTYLNIGQGDASYAACQTNEGTIGSLDAGTYIGIYAITKGTIAMGDGETITMGTKVTIGVASCINGNTIADIHCREEIEVDDDTNIYNGPDGVIGDITVNTTADITICLNEGRIGNLVNEKDNVFITNNAGIIGTVNVPTSITVTTNSGTIGKLDAGTTLAVTTNHGTVGDIDAGGTVTITTNTNKIGNVKSGMAVIITANSGEIGTVNAYTAVTITANGATGIIGNVTAETGTITVGVTNNKNAPEKSNDGTIGALNAGTYVIIYRNTGTILSVTAGTYITIGQNSATYQPNQNNAGTIGTLDAGTYVSIMATSPEGKVAMGDGESITFGTYIDIGSETNPNGNTIGNAAYRQGTTDTNDNDIYNGADGDIGNITVNTTFNIAIDLNEGVIGNVENRTAVVNVISNNGTVGNIYGITSVTITSNGEDGIIGTVTADSEEITIGTIKNTTAPEKGNLGTIGDMDAGTTVAIYRNLGTVADVTAGTAITIGQSGATYVDIQTNAGTIGGLNAGTTVAIYAGDAAGKIGDVVAGTTVIVGATTNPSRNAINSITAEGTVTVGYLAYYNEGAIPGGITSKATVSGYSTVRFDVDAKSNVVIFGTAEVEEDNYIHTAGGTLALTAQDDGSVLVTNGNGDTLHTYPAGSSISMSLMTKDVTGLTIGEGVTVDTMTSLVVVTNFVNNGTIHNIDSSRDITMESNVGTIDVITNNGHTTIESNLGTIGSVSYSGTSTGKINITNEGTGTVTGSITNESGVGPMVITNLGTTPLACDISQNVGTLILEGHGANDVTEPLFTGNISVNGSLTMLGYMGENTAEQAIAVTMNKDGGTVSLLRAASGFYLQVLGDVTKVNINSVVTVENLNTVDFSGLSTDLVVSGTAGATTVLLPEDNSGIQSATSVAGTAITENIEGNVIVTGASIYIPAGVTIGADALTSLANNGAMTILNYGTVGDLVTLNAGSGLNIYNYGTMGNVSAVGSVSVITNEGTIEDISSTAAIVVGGEKVSSDALLTVTGTVAGQPNITYTKGNLGTIGNLDAKANAIIYRNTGTMGSVTTGTTLVIGQNGAAYAQYQTNAGTIGSLDAGTTVSIFAISETGKIAADDGESISFTVSVDIGSSGNINGNTIGDIAYRQGTAPTSDNDIYNGATGKIGNITVNSIYDVQIVTNQGEIGNVTNLGDNIIVTENMGKIGNIHAATSVTLIANGADASIEDITGDTGAITIGEDKNKTTEKGNDGEIGNIDGGLTVNVYRNTGTIKNVTAETSIVIGQTGNAYIGIQDNAGTIGSLDAGTYVNIYATSKDGKIATGDGESITMETAINIGTSTNINGNTIGDVSYREGTSSVDDNDIYNGADGVIGDITVNATLDITVVTNAGKIGNLVNKKANVVVISNSGSVKNMDGATSVAVTDNSGTIEDLKAGTTVTVTNNENTIGNVTAGTSVTLTAAKNTGNVTAGGDVTIGTNSGEMGTVQSGTNVTITANKAGGTILDVTAQTGAIVIGADGNKTTEKGNDGEIGNLVAGTTVNVYRNTGTLKNVTAGTGIAIGQTEAAYVGYQENSGTIGSLDAGAHVVIYTTSPDGKIATGDGESITFNDYIKIGSTTNLNGNKIGDSAYRPGTSFNNNSFIYNGEDGEIGNVSVNTTTYISVGLNEGTIKNVKNDLGVTNVTNNSGSLGTIDAATTITVSENSGIILDITAGGNVAITKNTKDVGNVYTDGNVAITTNGANATIKNVTSTAGEITIGVGNNLSTEKSNDGKIGNLNAGLDAKIYRNTGTIEDVTAGGCIAVGQSEEKYGEIQNNSGTIGGLDAGTYVEIFAISPDGKIATDDGESITFVTELNIGSSTNRNGNKIGNISYREGTSSVLDNDIYNGSAGDIGNVTVNTAADITVQANEGKIGNLVNDGKTINIYGNSGSVEDVTCGGNLTMGTTTVPDAGQYGTLTSGGATTLRTSGATEIDSLTVNNGGALEIYNATPEVPEAFPLTAGGSITSSIDTTNHEDAQPIIFSVKATANAGEAVTTQTLTGHFATVTKTGTGTLVVADSSVIDTLVIASGATNDVVYLGDVDTSIVPDEAGDSLLGGANNQVSLANYIYRTALTGADGQFTLGLTSYALDDTTFEETLEADENLTNVTGQIAVTDDYGNPVDFTVDGVDAENGVFALDVDLSTAAETHNLGTIVIDDYGYFTITFTQGVATSGENTRVTTSATTQWDNITLMSHGDVLFTVITSAEELEAAKAEPGNGDWAVLDGTYTYPALVVQVLPSAGIDTADMTYTVESQSGSNNTMIFPLEDADTFVAGQAVPFDVTVQKTGYETETKAYDWTVTAADVVALQPDQIAVTFDLLGGTGEISDVTCAPGTDIKLPVAPARENYTFYGWSIDRHTVYQPGTAYSLGENGVTFYAIWRAVDATVETYTLTLDSDYADIIFGAVDLQSFIAGTELTLTVAPRSNQFFGGWVVTGTEEYVENGKTLKVKMNTDVTVEVEIGYILGSNAGTLTTSTVNNGVINTIVSTTAGVSTATVTEEAAKSALDSATDNAVKIVVGTRPAGNTIELTLFTDALKALVEADVEQINISSPIISVEIPLAAAESIANQAKGDKITLEIKKIDVAAELTAEQQRLIGNGVVFDLRILCNGQEITNFGGNEILVTVPYALEAGQKEANLEVWYMADNGAISVVDSDYDSAQGAVVFATTHLSRYAVVYNENPFVDVNLPAYYYAPVLWAADRGITTGVTPTTFVPNATVTRAEIVTFLYRAAGEPAVGGANPFQDVSQNSYYYNAVLWAVGNGITQGTSDTSFSPDAICTRDQMVTFLYRAAGAPAVTTANPFTDVAEGAYYYDAVLWAVANGITNGTSNTTFSPSKVCTRGESVTFLYRSAEQ